MTCAVTEYTTKLATSLVAPWCVLLRGRRSSQWELLFLLPGLISMLDTPSCIVGLVVMMRAASGFGIVCCDRRRGDRRSSGLKFGLLIDHLLMELSERRCCVSALNLVLMIHWLSKEREFIEASTKALKVLIYRYLLPLVQLSICCLSCLKWPLVGLAYVEFSVVQISADVVVEERIG